MGQWAENPLLASPSTFLPRDERITMCQRSGVMSQPYLCQTLPGNSTLLSLSFLSVLPPCRGIGGKTLGGGQRRPSLSLCIVLGFPQLSLSFS